MERIYENAVFNCMMPTISSNFDNSHMPIMEIYDYQDNRGYRRATWALEVLIQSFETEFNNNLGEFGEKYKTQIVERFKRAWQKEEYYSAQIEKWKSERKDVTKQIREVRQELLKTSEEEKNIYRDIDKQYGEQFLCYNDMIENAEAALYLIAETQLIIGHNQQSTTNNRGNTSPKLTHKQQMVLLDKLGFLDHPVFKELTQEKKAMIIGNLLNRNIQDTRALLTFYHGKSNTDKHYSKTPENIKAVESLLSSVGLFNSDEEK